MQSRGLFGGVAIVAIVTIGEAIAVVVPSGCSDHVNLAITVFVNITGLDEVRDAVVVAVPVKIVGHPVAIGICGSFYQVRDAIVVVVEVKVVHHPITVKIIGRSNEDALHFGGGVATQVGQGPGSKDVALAVDKGRQVIREACLQAVGAVIGFVGHIAHGTEVGDVGVTKDGLVGRHGKLRRRGIAEEESPGQGGGVATGIHDGISAGVNSVGSTIEFRSLVLHQQFHGLVTVVKGHNFIALAESRWHGIAFQALVKG